MSAPMPPPNANSESSDRAERSSAGSDMGERVRAYPGTLTYLDLMRRNRRESVLLIIAMILLAAVLGAAIGALIASYVGSHAHSDRLATDRFREGEAASMSPLAMGVLAGAGLGLVLSMGGAAWSWFGGASTLLRMTHARPIEKHEDPELFNVVEEMSIAAGLPMPRVYLVRDSAMNAFATGRDPTRGVVAVTTGLREKLTREELQAVIAHEMAHIRHLDIRFAMLVATMVGLIVVVSDGLLHSLWHGGAHAAGSRSTGRGRGGGPAVIVLLVIALILAIVAPILARLIQMSYSRRREYLADAGAVELTRNPQAMASALSRLATDDDPQVDTANRGMAHMFIVNPTKKMRASHQQLNSLFASHPPIKERIAKMLALTR